MAQRVRRGEVGFAAAHLGYFLGRIALAVIGGEHESVDENAGALAFETSSSVG